MIPKLILTSTVALALTCPAIAEPQTATGTYKEISKLIDAGKVAEATASMTDEAKRNFLLDSLGLLAEVYAAGEKMKDTFTLSDGSVVKATPSDLGFDTFDFPDWLSADRRLPADDVIEAHYESLGKLLDKAENRSDFLRSMMLLSRDVGGTDFGGKLVPPIDGSAPRPDLIWVEIGMEDEQKAIPIRFKKIGEQWKYDGVDIETMMVTDLRHKERKNLQLSGKTLEGTEISLSDYKDKVVLVDFWGTW